MSDDVRRPGHRPASRTLPIRAPDSRAGAGAGAGRRKPRLRKLRAAAILIGLGALAIVSTVFGMMMAVASDIPQIENAQQYHERANSFLYDDHWRSDRILRPAQQRRPDRRQATSRRS